MLTKIYNLTAKPLILLPFCALFLYVGCEYQSQLINPSHDNAITGSTQYDGQTLFRGIILGDGPVADLIPEIRKHLRIKNANIPEEQLIFIRELHNELISTIEINYPEFFDYFQKSIASGDHLTINRAIYKANEASLSSMSDLPMVKEAIEEMRNNPGILDEIYSSLNDAPNLNDIEIEKKLELMKYILAAKVADEDLSDIFLSIDDEIKGLWLWAVMGIVMAAWMWLIIVQDVLFALNFGMVVNVVEAVAAWQHVVAWGFFDDNDRRPDCPDCPPPVPEGPMEKDLFKEQLINSIVVKLS